MDEFACSALEGQGHRKSERERKKKRSFSPDLDLDQLSTKVRSGQAVKKKKKKTISGSSFAPDRPYDKLPNGMPFSCDLCKTSYVCNPLMSKRGSRVKRSKHMPSPRIHIDPTTGKTLLLCNACGLALDRPKKPKKLKPLPSQEEKDKYLLEAKLFASTLAGELNVPEAEVLYCPSFKMAACKCLQAYIEADGNKDDMRKRGLELTELHKEAKRLSALKFYDTEKLSESGRKGKRAKNIGLGNGQKKSAAYEMFVLEKREVLRRTMSLCERATQKVLRYSNNFLHKKLKTEERGCRAQRVKGKAALGQLRSLMDLHTEKCCIDNCVRMALTHHRLLLQWRERATSGQQEARRVLAEMLTPSGGVRSNCYKFITWVTGCSASTIGKVNDQMKQTGGEREPPQHGLRKYWMENPRRISSDSLSQTHNDSIGTSSMLGSPSCPSETSPTISGGSTVTSPATVQPQTQQGNNEAQQQFMQQQTQLLKMLEQKLIETQMMQQTLMQQIARPESLAPVQGMLSQLGQFQVAAANSPQFQANVAQSTLNQLPQTHTPNSQNTQLETVALTQGQTTPTSTTSNTQKSSVLSQVQQLTAGRSGQQVTVQSQQQFSNGHPQFQVPVLGNPQPNVLHLQAPNIQIKLAQPQYVVQSSPIKSNAVTSTTQAEVQNTSSQLVSDQKPRSAHTPLTKTNQSTEMTGQTIQISEQNVLRHFTKDEITHIQNVPSSEQSNMVKIGNQIHQVINLHPQQLSQVVAQPIQLQNIRPNLQGLRIPVIQPAQRPQQPQNQQVPFYPQDSSRPQLPQFVTVAPLNPEQMQQRGIQNICVPARLPVGSPISLQQLQQLQQMFVQSQRHTEPSIQQKQVNKLAPHPETKENSAVSSQQSQSLGKDASTASSQGSRSAETQIELPHCKEPCNAAHSLQRHKHKNSGPTGVSNTAPQSENVTQCSTVNSSVETSSGPVSFHGLNEVRQHSQEQKPSSVLLAQHAAAEDSTKINFNELESHGLGDFAQLQSVGQGQGHDSNQGQTGPNSQGVNCALVVQSVPNTNSETLRSGHQTPSSELDEMLRSFVINRHGDFDLVSPLTLPDNITRSRNNSGESTIEPTISVDMSSFPRELLSIIAPQALTITISNGQSHNANQ
ncbi:putative uncharacterized protein DDB_G0271606 isoform X2 [Haliotis rufescens]|nr:putative uncharacterized protein DDB_G0271606 isoform X2 [Haliotis rufescens]XP_046341367.1 putative uncharacterized protein DDB_G0271606 isoform X2 [Haliotis rufescens]XP_048245334.1 putative uncharacterized protein DDB_G0271606 isoform X2 [Haliotis rufescens]XP_048245335.1 putative uncharacterized protein DDB_G0271606 isoform X2 [Haliotis rufescens]